MNESQIQSADPLQICAFLFIYNSDQSAAPRITLNRIAMIAITNNI
jgi:hypothetical protein